MMKSGPVCPLSAKVCRTLDAVYIEVMATVEDEGINMALKKCANDHKPASTTAITKTD